MTELFLIIVLVQNYIEYQILEQSCPLVKVGRQFHAYTLRYKMNLSHWLLYYLTVPSSIDISNAVVGATKCY